MVCTAGGVGREERGEEEGTVCTAHKKLGCIILHIGSHDSQFHGKEGRYKGTDRPNEGSITMWDRRVGLGCAGDTSTVDRQGPFCSFHMLSHG